jgi:RNA polymerase sigma-70 factor (ECF subfamily)
LITRGPDGVSGVVSRPDPTVVGRVFRAESGRAVAALIRAFGDIDLAEDAVQDAFVIALRTWPDTGVPPNPGGWITTTARNRAIDRLRREARGRDLLAAAALHDGVDETDATQAGESIPDDRLRLIFTCCHPALSEPARVALTLRLVAGLSTREVARAFLVAEHTMAVRLVRAKRKIKAARIPYRVPVGVELPGRLRSVLAVVYLVYTAGLSGPPDTDLCGEAIRLARLLTTLLPSEPETDGLVALLVFTESRRASRTRRDGTLVPLGEQDRGQWDRALIEEGRTLLRRCLERNRPGPYQLQAAINAVHADAATIEDTDWAQIITLYDHLLAIAPTPVAALNRAVALGEARGPAAALCLVDELDLDEYYLFHATRADLLHRLGRVDDAALAYRRAAELAPTDAEREFLRRGGRHAQWATRR